MARHCYLVQSHRNPGQIARLARTLRRSSPDASVVISHDASACALHESDIPGCRLLLTREPVARGEWSKMQAYLDAVESLATLGVDYDWLTNLSGQDYPLQPLCDYESFVERAGVDGFLSYGDIFGPDNPWAPRRHQGHRRYYYHYRRLSSHWQPWLRRLRILNNMQHHWHLHATMGAYLGTLVRKLPFTDAYRCYGGSEWHTLSRRCVEYLRAEVVEGHPVREHFKHTMEPVEACVQTVLVNSGLFSLSRDHLRYIDFTGSVGGAPRLLHAADRDALIASGKFFARKFDSDVDELILDQLDEHLAGTTRGRQVEPLSGRDAF